MFTSDELASLRKLFASRSFPPKPPHLRAFGWHERVIAVFESQDSPLPNKPITICATVQTLARIQNIPVSVTKQNAATE